MPCCARRGSGAQASPEGAWAELSILQGRLTLLCLLSMMMCETGSDLGMSLCASWVHWVQCHSSREAGSLPFFSALVMGPDYSPWWGSFLLGFLQWPLFLLQACHLSTRYTAKPLLLCQHGAGLGMKLCPALPTPTRPL